MKHEGWTAAAAVLGVDLPDRAETQLDRYERFLVERAATEGMVAPGDAPRIRSRHILDCLRAARLVGAADRRAYDLGSGAGLPGVVVAIACPMLEIVLVEARRHRSDFLKEVVEELALTNATVHAGRAEWLTEQVDLCFSRAFAPVGRSWRAAGRLLSPAGRLIYWAGRTADPLGELGASVSADLVTPPDGTDSGPLVIIRRRSAE